MVLSSLWFLFRKALGKARVNILKVSDKTSIKAAAPFGDVGRRGRALLECLREAVVAVHFPSFQEADADRVVRAEEGAAHAHVAAVAEPYLSALDADVVFGAISGAQPAERAFVCIRAVEKELIAPPIFCTETAAAAAL